ncbi:MAG: peptidase [Cyanobacteria bacterium RYN_339]|nr:peptidase [Cyanobacteria bacterium RYN_339]
MRTKFLLIPLLLLAGCGGGGNPLIPQLRPVAGGYISSGYGQREDHPVLGYVPGRHHDGYDFAVAAGSPVHATMEGEVVSAGWMGGYGNAVVLRHPNGYETLYGHAQELLVSKGQRVNAGDTIARVGSTGLSTGPHLHYELHKDGQAVDPGGFSDAAPETLPKAIPAAYHPPREQAARPIPPVHRRVMALRTDRPACEGGLN